MSAIEPTGLPPAPAESSKAGRRFDAACSNSACDESQFVGRTSVPAPGRALVPTTLSRPSAVCLTRPRQSAVFLAHLIATAQEAPQTRARRRAEPEEARAVYLVASAAATELGRLMHQVI
jgi:hypothetical protein